MIRSGNYDQTKKVRMFFHTFYARSVKIMNVLLFLSPIFRKKPVVD